MSIEGQGSLRIDELQEQDAGLYTCRAMNAEDSIDADVVLRVLSEHRFLLSETTRSHDHVKLYNEMSAFHRVVPE